MQEDSLPAEPQRKPKNTGVDSLSLLQGDLPDPEVKPGSLALQADSLPTELSSGPGGKRLNRIISNYPAHFVFHKVLICYILCSRSGFPGGSAGKESSCNVGDLGLIPGLGRSLEKGNGYPLQYSGLEDSRVGHD